MDDREDEAFATAGYMGTLAEPVIRDADGRVVWDVQQLDWIEGDAPASVHPGLWRHAQLLRHHGLFRVADRIYQVRGLDSANLTIVVGDTGFIVLDTLTTTETARAAIALARQYLGDLPIRAIIYSHAHADHFGGAAGLVDGNDIEQGRVQIFAPRGFLDHALREHVVAGVAMGRRATYMVGASLNDGPTGRATVGIGAATPSGSISLLAPTDYIRATGDEITIDGVRIQFQLTTDTEAPEELNAYLPDQRALWLSENANSTMHNVLTPRGAAVRDALVWARSLTEALDLYGDEAETMFTSHTWPRFGNRQIREFLSSHRDSYKFLHDQTVRMMNMGMTGTEIAEHLRLPRPLAERWFNRGYYGSLSFNARAVYQRYMGWYDGNPVHLNSLPEEQAAPLYVRAMGGAGRVLREARRAFRRGEYRWTAEVLNHLVFAEPSNANAREMLARTYEQLAYQAENAVWRNIYLSAAVELRGSPNARTRFGEAPGLAEHAPSTVLFDLLAVRVDPDRARDQRVNFTFPERGETFAVRIQNGVLIAHEGRLFQEADATFTMERSAFSASLFGSAAPRFSTDANAGAFQRFVDCFDRPNPSFAIVTPN